MKKIVLRYVVCLWMLFSLSSIVLADDTPRIDYPSQNRDGYGVQGQWPIHDVSQNTYNDWSSTKTGTKFTATVDGVTVEMIFDENSSPVSDKVKFYDSYNSASWENAMSEFPVDANGKRQIEMGAEDMAAIFDAKGYPDIADKIRNGSAGRGDMFVTQVAWVGAPTTTSRNATTGEGYQWMEVSVLKEMAQSDPNLNFWLYDILHAGNWSDDEMMGELAWYWIEQTPTIEEEPEVEPEPEVSPEPDEPEVTPPPNATPPPPPSTGLESPPSPRPGTYEIIFKNMPDTCGKSISGSLQIFGDKFHVENGDPIPTSERLGVRGENNYVGKVDGIQYWEMNILDPGSFVYYHYDPLGYEIWISERDFAYDDSGDRMYASDGSPLYTEWGEPTKVGYSQHNLSDGILSGSEGRTYRSNAGFKYDLWAYNLDIPRSQLENVEFLSTHFASIKQEIYAKVTNRALNGTVSWQVSPPGASMGAVGVHPVTKPVTAKSRTLEIGAGSKITKSTFESYVMAHFYSITTGTLWTGPESDAPLTVSAGGGSASYTKNCVMLTDDFGLPSYSTSYNGRITVPNIENNSLGEGYTSTGEYEWYVADGGSGLTTTPVDVNSVRVHTPIHVSANVYSISKNQLIANTIPDGGKYVVTLDDPFTVQVTLNGASHYYTPVTTDLQKYVKEITYHCEVCGGQGTLSSLSHPCSPRPDLEDNKVYTCRIEVAAINEPVGSSGIGAEEAAGSGFTNVPDSSYRIEYVIPIFVAGKMWDFEVRTVDDPGWKLLQAEKLSKLPVGESGDNTGNIKYTSPLKLGYRAFFDLKTLSKVSTSVKIKPRIWYVDKATGKIDNTKEIWYRNKASATSYVKLKEAYTDEVIGGNSDIEIKMNMATTFGDVNNDPNGMTNKKLFDSEKLRVMKDDLSANYNQEIYEGGLKEITLSKNQMTGTSYQAKDGTEYVYGGSTHADAKRWYGEVFIPASTKVVPSGSNAASVSNAKGLDGYIVISFDEIGAYLADGTSYLQYGIAKNPLLSSMPPYIMLNEKNGKGNTVQITLPNGKPLTDLPSDFYATDAPIIIYDLSLRANEDYSSSGTH